MLHLELTGNEGVPKSTELYSRLRTMILGGELSGGEALPPTRVLAADLGVSRTVVLEAYDRLHAEGFTETRTGSGTRVTPGVRLPPPPEEPEVPLPPAGFLPVRTDIVDFRSGVPDLSRFPFAAWKAAMRDVWNEVKPEDLAYSGPEGRLELRRSIADHLLRFRGIRCGPDRIIVTSGTTQAIGIVSRMFLRGGPGEVFIEDPITKDIGTIIRSSGGTPVPVPLDASGLVPEAFPESTPRFVYVTPSHQFPLGMTMPAPRRVDLVEYARKAGTYLVEDDYDSEFRYDSPPVGSLRELCPDRVIYIGTFSKTLFPSLRTAYIVLPFPLVQFGRLGKWETDLHNATIDQLVLSAFMDRGDYARHVSAMRRLYRRKREVLLGSLRSAFGDGAEPLGSPTGMHVTVRFRGIDFTRERLGRLEERGVKVYPVEFHAMRKGFYRDCVILGFGMLAPEAIRKGVSLLAEHLGAS